MLPRRTPWLMLVTEDSPDLLDVVQAASAGGVDIIQYRNKLSSIDSASAMVSAIRSRIDPNTILALNTPDSHAFASASDWLHFTENSLHFDGVHCDVSHQFGFSVHSVEAAIEARSKGASYVVAGSVFATKSHPGIVPIGIRGLMSICRSVDIPVIAIGGVVPENARDCVGAGAAGIAVLSGITRATNVLNEVLRYRNATDSPSMRP